MRVFVIGLRGFPDVAGGVESHCEHLYSALVKKNVDVSVIVRSPYVSHGGPPTWNCISFVKIWSPVTPGVEALVHSLIGVLFSAIKRPNILHIHSIGPAIFTPLARLVGLKVVVTHHASDYNQAKWGLLGRSLLRAGEAMAARFANELICVSRHGAAEIELHYGRKPIVIPNGVVLSEDNGNREFIKSFGLVPGRYFLHVGRAIPDKRQDDLLEAFSMVARPGWKLVLVGDLTGSDKYSQRVRALAKVDKRVILAGFRSGLALKSLYGYAGCFVMPSSYEGFPIALLEALSFGVPVIASDIPAHREVELPVSSYFSVGNVPGLADLMMTGNQFSGDETWTKLRAFVNRRYNWDAIAEQVKMVYKEIMTPAA